MPRKPEPVATPTVIKWTEEEWERIASRLLEMKGRELLKSPQLEEIKAKDVFLAQEALSESRHRKLISISQGFQAIRQRLHSIMQKLDAVPQNDLFGGSSPVSNSAAATASGTAAETAENKEDASVAKAAKETQVLEENAEKSTASLHQGAADSFDGEKRPDVVAGTEVEPDADELPAAKTHPQHHYNDRSNERPRTPRPQQGADSRRSSHSLTPSPSQDTTGNFVELARPFVAMVCEELAAALVKTMMEKGGNQSLSSLFQAVLSGAEQGSPVDSRPKRGQQSAQPFTKQAANGAPAAEHPVSSPADDEDAHLAEMDVQPLFDPKLPPSPNSSFKPMIALIGISARDFEDLQPRFPQLELTTVALDDLRTAPSLRNCQRMIGLREDIPAPADEFLRKTFRNRYLRITGGIAQVSEQLNAWLDNPGTMNAGSNWPRKQGGGKTQTNGYPKKRQFRRPRPNQ